MIHKVKGFGIVNKAEIYVFWHSLAFLMIQWMLPIWSLIPLPFLIPVCASSSPAFLMMYSAYKLNKQGDNIQPWCTTFPIWNHNLRYTSHLVYFHRLLQIYLRVGIYECNRFYCFSKSILKWICLVFFLIASTQQWRTEGQLVGFDVTALIHGELMEVLPLLLLQHQLQIATHRKGKKHLRFINYYTHILLCYKLI